MFKADTSAVSRCTSTQPVHCNLIQVQFPVWVGIDLVHFHRRCQQRTVYVMPWTLPQADRQPHSMNIPVFLNWVTLPVPAICNGYAQQRYLLTTQDNNGTADIATTTTCHLYYLPIVPNKLAVVAAGGWLSSRYMQSRESVCWTVGRYESCPRSRRGIGRCCIVLVSDRRLGRSKFSQQR